MQTIETKMTMRASNTCASRRSADPSRNGAANAITVRITPAAEPAPETLRLPNPPRTSPCPVAPVSPTSSSRRKATKAPKSTRLDRLFTTAW